MAKPTVIGTGEPKGTTATQSARSVVDITPIKTDDREIDGLARDTTQSFEDLAAQIEHLKIVPEALLRTIEQTTELWWLAADDPTASIMVSTGAQQRSLVRGATAIIDDVGLVNERALRLYGAAAGRTARAAVSGPSGWPVTTVSAWVRLSNTGGVNQTIMGYIDAAGANTTVTLGLNANRIPFLTVLTAAGSRTVTGSDDMRIADGQWHYIGGSFDGKVPLVSVDGISFQDAALAYSPLSWIAAGAPAWSLGFPSGAGCYGIIQDARVESVAKPASWFREYWKGILGLQVQNNPTY